MNNELARLRQENEELRAQLAADPYTKIEELGSGGFCTVWRATRRVDDDHHIEVCLKELKPELREDPACVRYFRREGRIASNLRHGKIPLLIDVDFARHRLVYALVDGVDLRRLRAHAGGKLASDLVILVGLEIASALDYAHSRTRKDAAAGVIHRDLTPANVMVSVDGQVLLADFGVAAIESPEPQTSIRGTAAYMSPEQARGRPVDAGTDLFSLGVVLYELVSGRRPFDGDGDDPASLERLGRCEYPPLKSIVPDTSDALITVITRLLQKKRDERYKSAREAVSAFSAIAPSHDVVQRLGDLSRAARRRETKPYSTLQLPGRIQTAVLHFAIPARDPQAHEVTTVVRPTPDSDSAWTVPTNYGSRRVHQRAIAAAIAAALIAVMFFVWPMSRSRSASGGEVMRNAASSLPPTLKISPPALARVAGEGVVSGSGLAEGTPPRVQPDEVVASTTGGTSPPAASENVATEQGPEDATIKVSADKSARVRIDGRFAGWSPLKSSLEPGKHTILIGEGAQQQTIKTQVAAGDTKEFFVKIRHPKN